MKEKDIIELITEKGLTITQLIDVVVKYNGIIGVGLVTLGNDLKRYCFSKMSSQSDTYE